MKKRLTKIGIVFLTLVILCTTVFAAPVSAASYPTIFFCSWETNTVVPKGETTVLKFTIFPEFKNEKYHVELYDSNGTLCASASSSYYNSSIMYRDVSITVNTATLDLAVGEYKVVYWLEFYSFYRWNECPNRYTGSISVIKDICKGNHKFKFNKVVDEPKCDEEGLDKYVCSKCGTMEYRETATKHTYNNPGETLACDTCGALDTKTTLVTVNGQKRYYTGGYWKKDTTLVNIDGTYYYIKDGVVCNDNTLVKYGSKWYHVKGGKLVKDTTLVKYNGVYYYVEKGVRSSKTTVVKYNGAYRYVENGKYTKVTGLKNCDGTYYYVVDGAVCNDNTLVKYNSKWYHVNNGKYVKDTTLVKYGKTWYYVKNGVKNTSNTLVKYNGKYRHVNGGKWVKDTTLVKYGKTWYYVENGNVNFDYSGKFRYKGKNYTIKKGIKV